MAALIAEFLSQGGNAQGLLHTIAGILKLELENQKKLAEQSDAKNKKDYDIKVFVENERPWDMAANAAAGAKNLPFPLVNISLSGIQEAAGKGSNYFGKIKYTGTYTIDCYGCGNWRDAGDAAHAQASDDFLAASRAWVAADTVRRILMSGHYLYLGRQGVVMSRKVSKIDTISADKLENSSLTITACRVTFEVEFYETAPEAVAANLEGAEIKITDGEVEFATMEFNGKQ